CFVQFYAKAEKLFRIKKNCFLPKPKVESCLLKLKMYRTPEIKVKDESLMFKIIRKAFSQRRKKMINPLSDKEFLNIDKQTWQKILETCKIDPSSRAEDLSLEKYAKVADYVRSEL
ncbi:MAG: rRNA adenine N-6-methyltransferase family protein, partial [Candidatus Omnitrophota bacterium]